MDEDDAVAVEHNADQARELLVVTFAQFGDLILDLLDRVGVGGSGIAVAQRTRTLVLHDHAPVNRVGLACAYQSVVDVVKVNASFAAELDEKGAYLEAKLDLVVRGSSGGADLGREPLGVLSNLPV
jgi:hypothetical protein